MVACCSIKCQFFLVPGGIALQKEMFVCFRFSLVGLLTVLKTNLCESSLDLTFLVTSLDKCDWRCVIFFLKCSLRGICSKQSEGLPCDETSFDSG